MMLQEEIEAIIRDFNFDNFGVNVDAHQVIHEWPPELARLIAEHVGHRINTVIRVAQGMAL